MARKQKKSAKPEAVEYPRKAIPINAGKTKEETSRNFAELLTSPELAAFRVIDRAEQKSGLEDNIDVPTLLGTLRDQAAAVNLGELAKDEAMRIKQATALQRLFYCLIGREM